MRAVNTAKRIPAIKRYLYFNEYDKSRLNIFIVVYIHLLIAISTVKGIIIILSDGFGALPQAPIMNLKISFYVSILFYAFAIFFLVTLSSSKQEELNPIELQKGVTGIISFVFSNPTEGVKQNAITKEVSSIEGTIAEEIHKIQNKISYPPQALEDGLESECEWSVVIDEKQKASQIKIIRACQYKIFEEEFRRVIEDWKFSLPENTILQIPVSFKIRSE